MLQRTVAYLRALATNRYFWGGLAGLFLLGLIGYFTVDSLLMPTYTRHDAAITVPDVLGLHVDDAQRMLAQQDLEITTQPRRFTPNAARDAIVDQHPPPNALVKPGRKVNLIVNSGTAPTVQVPSVLELSLREARNRVISVGLNVAAQRPDSIPSPHPNTVTRQQPAPGTQVDQGSDVTLWYSTGLGDRYVTVPDLTGLTVGEATSMLVSRYRLRSVLVGANTAQTQKVSRQSQPPGTRVKEGFEIRLFVDAPGQ